MKRQKSFDSNQPTLYLIPTPIGNLQELTPRAIELLKSVDYIAAEDTRHTLQLLNHFDINAKLISHHEHNIKASSVKILQLMKDGHSIALVSDAGYPAISDPGYELVKEVIAHDYNVVPVSGCNACLDALVVSGIAPQPFMFYGFLDHSDKKKRKQLKELQNINYSMVFYEAPHRITKTLSLMLDAFGDRSIALCRELTKRHEEIIRGMISEVLEISDSLKGEMVIVVEGSSETKTEDNYDFPVIEHIERLMNEGMTSKEAIKEVAHLRHLKKNDVYQEYIKKKNQ